MLLTQEKKRKKTFWYLLVLVDYIEILYYILILDYSLVVKIILGLMYLKFVLSLFEFVYFLVSLFACLIDQKN